jgi:hypothetical protein
MSKLKTQWMKQSGRFCYIALLVMLSCLSVGCASRIKTRTITTREKTIYIDTVLHIQFDKTPLVTEVSINEIAVLENKTSIARSYYSPEKKKIVLELTGKTVDVPIKIQENIKETTNIKQKEIINKNPFWVKIVLFVLGIISGIFVTNKILKR